MLGYGAPKKVSTLPLLYALGSKHKALKQGTHERDRLELALFASFDLPKQEMRERELPIDFAPRRGFLLATWHSPMHKRALL